MEAEEEAEENSESVPPDGQVRLFVVVAVVFGS